MTDRAQFEAMLEALINDDQETAKEIFHNIVVGKSREIYEELLESDFGQDTGNPYKKEEEEESANPFASSEEEEGEEEEGEEEEGEEEEGEEEEGEEEGEEEEDGTDGEESEEGEGAIEDRVMDLEDALEDLKAEFEHLLAGEEHEEETGVAGDHGGEMDAIPGFDGADEEPVDELHGLMEYVNKVGNVQHGDNGANAQSIVAGPNDMGGTAGNIAQSFSTTTGGTQGGLANPKTEDLTAGLGTVHNRPGADAGKTAFKKKEAGHGAEKKGERPGKEVGAANTSGRGESNTQSTLRPLKK